MAYCDEYLELISAAIDGALSPAERETLEAHLASCPECKALYGELTALHTALGDLPPVEVPEDLTARIMRAVAAEQVLPFAPAEKRKTPVRWRRWLASAAVLAVVLIGTWSWKPWENRAKDMLVAPAQEIQAVKDAALPQTEPPPEAADLEEESLPLQSPDGEPAPQALDSAADAQSKAESPAPAAYTSRSAEPAPTPVSPQETVPEETPAAANSIAPRMALAGAVEAPLPSEPIPENGQEDQNTALQKPVLFSSTPVSNDPAVSEAPEETPAPFLRAAPDPGQPSPFSLEETGEVQDLTVEEALERVVEYIFEYSAPQDLTWETQEGEESLVCTIRWTDGGEEQTLVLLYFGPAEPLPEEYVFACPQEDLHPYAYLVHRTSGQVDVMCMD